MISIIAAMSQNRSLGKDNKIPWHISEDFLRAKKLTMGHPIVMGRKTHESIAGFKKLKGWEESNKKLELKPLPGRTNIIITRKRDFISPGSTVVHSIEEAIEVGKRSEGGEEIFIFGGAKIYEEFFGIANKLYITKIEEEIDGDVFFPEIKPEEWIQESNKLRITRVLDNEIRYRFMIYKRK